MVITRNDPGCALCVGETGSPFTSLRAKALLFFIPICMLAALAWAWEVFDRGPIAPSHVAARTGGV